MVQYPGRCDLTKVGMSKAKSQTSVDAGSVVINTLYSLLLIAGPILRSVRAPLRFADFWFTSISVSFLLCMHACMKSGGWIYLQILQHKRTVFAERLDESDEAWVLGRDAVGNGRGDADDFLEHLDKGVVFVLAGFDLAGFHAEGAFEVHTLHPALCLAGCTCVVM